MRLHGYCTSCRRFRLVRVTFGWGLALAQGAAHGICSECEDAEDARRRGSKDAR